MKDFIKQAKFFERNHIYADIDYQSLMDALNLIKSIIPDNNDKNIIQISAKELINTWLVAFHLTPEILDLSKEELEALEKYLYVNKLILDCKEQAVRVSVEAWEKIEVRMLLPR